MKLFLLVILLIGIPHTASRAAEAQEVGGAAHHVHMPAEPSTALSVSTGEKHVVLSPADLQALPQTTVTVLNGHTKTEETYTGPLVSDVLAKVGIVLNSASEHSILHSYVVATGTDGYFVVFSGAELQSALHKGQCIVALSKAGQPLGETGAFQLIETLEIKPARWVRNLKDLEIVSLANPQ